MQVEDTLQKKQWTERYLSNAKPFCSISSAEYMQQPRTRARSGEETANFQQYDADREIPGTF